MKKYIIFTLLLVSVGVSAQTDVKAELDSTQIRIGDQTVFALSITAPKGIAIKTPKYEVGKNLSAGMEIVEIAGDTIDVDNDRQQINQRLTITAWDEGTYNINPQKIKIGGKEYSTDKKILKVITMEVDTLHPEQMKPAKDVMDNPFSWLEWLPLLGWLLVVAALVVVLRYLRKMIRENRRLFPNVLKKKKLLPHEKALQSIEEIKREELEKSVDQKTYYTRLTDTLREYLEERFSINAKEMTSGEIVDQLMAEEDMTKVDELRELFLTADLVKFAKYSTANNENAMYLANVAQFVEETKSEEQPQLEPSEAEKIEEERQNRRQHNIIKALMAAAVVAIIAILIYVGWQVYELLM